jgi:hypothetical protein
MKNPMNPPPPPARNTHTLSGLKKQEIRKFEANTKQLKIHTQSKLMSNHCFPTIFGLSNGREVIKAALCGMSKNC